MASSYSTDLKLELMATGENAGTWGDKTNTNLNLVQQAIAGFEQITLTSGGTVALVMSDGAISTARNLVIKFATITAAASTVCTIPDSIEKFYIFDVTGVTNPTNLTIKTASGTGFTPDAQKIYAAYSDGTNLNEVSLDTLGGSIGTAQVADSAITTAKIADDAVTSAKIADDAIVAAGIADNAVGTAAIADDAVTADKLANTSVTAASYTLSSITVDAQGRITAASSGAAGGSGYVLTKFNEGPASGTHTSAPSSTLYQLYMWGGGGGAGGPSPSGSPNNGRGGEGGTGGFGFFTGPISSNTGYPFVIGAGGSGGNQGYGSGPGGAGTASTIFSRSSNGGNGGGGIPNRYTPGSNGSAGDAPGSSVPGTPRNIWFGQTKGATIGNGGEGQANSPSPTGQAGGDGAMVIFEA